MKLRPDSAIASLTDAQREQLYDWLLSHTYPEVQEIAAKPADEGGLGVKFHRTTLVRFFDKEREDRQAQELAELAANSDIDHMPQRIDLLITASKTRLAQATYDLARAANNPDDYDRLDRALHHIDSIRVKREELSLERERMAEQKRQWEFDAACEVMRNFLEYQKIHQQPNVDEVEKIWQARDIAFGKAATQSNTIKHDLQDRTPSDTPPFAKANVNHGDLNCGGVGNPIKHDLEDRASSDTPHFSKDNVKNGDLDGGGVGDPIKHDLEDRAPSDTLPTEANLNDGDPIRGENSVPSVASVGTHPQPDTIQPENPPTVAPQPVTLSHSGTHSPASLPSAPVASVHNAATSAAA